MRCGNAEARPFLYVIISGAPWLFLFLYILYIVYRKLCPAAAGIWILPKNHDRRDAHRRRPAIWRLCPAVAGFVAVGLGCGPIFPCMLHATPTNFGAEHSGSVIGVQMAFAYCGMTFTPILFGKLAEATTIRLLPFGVALLAGLVLLFTELLNRSVAKRKAADKLR